MDIACGVLLGMCYQQTSFNSFRGGGRGRNKLKEPHSRRQIPRDIGLQIGDFIKNEDIAYTTTSEQVIGARPMPTCGENDFIKACSIGLHKLKYLVEKCPNNVLQNPYLDNTQFIPEGSMTDPTKSKTMRIRQECILSAAKAEHLDVLKYLFTLPGFHFMQHWRVLLQTEPKEIATLNKKMLARIRN